MCWAGALALPQIDISKAEIKQEACFITGGSMPVCLPVGCSVCWNACASPDVSKAKCTQEACFLTGGSMPACWTFVCVLERLRSPKFAFRCEMHASGVFLNRGQCAFLLDVLCAGALALPQTFRKPECTQETWTCFQQN